MPLRFRFRTKPPPAAAALVGHGYTVTQYVAPFALVSGATSDEEDRGATAWTNASSESTPTTMGTAMARAVAGNIIEAAPGNYLGAIVGANTPIFQFAQAGTSGNPIILTGKYPAAYNATERSQFKRIADPGTGESCPIWGSRNYTILDGFYFNYADGASPHTRGILYFGFAMTGMEARRCRFLRADLNGADSGDNFNCIHFHGATSCKVRDCLFENGYDDIGSHNCAAMTFYGSLDVTIENNTFDNVTTGIYVKASDGTNYSSGVIRFNYFYNNMIGIECANGEPAAVLETTQNLFVMAGASGAQHCFSFDSSPGGEGLNLVQNFNVHHNTLIGAGDPTHGTLEVDDNIDGTGCSFANNIVAQFNTSASPLIDCKHTLTNFTAFDFNRYYENGQTIQYYFQTGLNAGIAAWRTASGRDANSTEGDPQFVNQATGDYRLAGGSPCLTASSTGGPIGCYITGSEEIGLRASPTY